MDDILNPVGPRNPNSHVMEAGKAFPEQEFEAGVEQIPLPSKGVFYGMPYYQVENLHCRSLDFRDEDILTTRQYIEDGSVFDKVVSAVIQDKGMSASKLVPVDRDTILLWLRSKALGNVMEIDYNCVDPMCKAPNKAKWDISTFDLPEYEPDVLAQLKENGYYKVTLPGSNLTVHLTVPLIEQSKDTETKFLKKKQNEKIGHDLLATASLSLVVAGIEIASNVEDEPPKVIRGKNEIYNYFVNNKLGLMDSRVIMNESKKLNLKYDTKQNLQCSTCGYIQEGVDLPIVHQNFLWLGLSS